MNQMLCDAVPVDFSLPAFSFQPFAKESIKRIASLELVAIQGFTTKQQAAETASSDFLNSLALIPIVSGEVIIPYTAAATACLIRRRHERSIFAEAFPKHSNSISRGNHIVFNNQNLWR